MTCKEMEPKWCSVIIGEAGMCVFCAKLHGAGRNSGVAGEYRGVSLECIQP